MIIHKVQQLDPIKPSRREQELLAETTLTAEVNCTSGREQPTFSTPNSEHNTSARKRRTRPSTQNSASQARRH